MGEVEANPKHVGFWCGLEVGREDRSPLPPNPYPLRTEDRRQWAEGYIIGRRLGLAQLEAARIRCQELT